MANASPAPRTPIRFAFSTVDPAVSQTIIPIDASDGALSSGVLYEPPGERPDVCVYLMHPRGEFSRHYLAPGLTDRGIAVFGHNSRYLNNDTDMVHERLLLDIAAGNRALRDRGYRHIVLIGNSGGGSLLAYYQAQAELEADARVTLSPGGDPIDLAHEEMPQGDCFIGLAAHPGEGRFMLNVLDPSLTDEADPTSYDPALDMYHPDNGYRPWPEPSHYESGWLATYREAQRARSLRIDGRARGFIEERHAHRAIESDDMAGLSVEEQLRVRRAAHLHRYLLVYRTLANPWYLDLTIDPSPRAMGSIFAPADPFLGNYGPGGLARIMTPRAWLSTWSGTASHADLETTIAGVTIPTLIIYPDADTDILPSEQQRIFAASAATDRTLVPLEGSDHYLLAAPSDSNESAPPRERVIEILLPWIRERLA